MAIYHLCIKIISRGKGKCEKKLNRQKKLRPV